MPLKSSKQVKESYLGGEKAYGRLFNIYKPISHFIAAREFMKKENNLLSSSDPKSIKQLLELSHWLRTRLLWLYTPNVKDNILFTEETLMPLPDWIASEGVAFPLEPFEEKLRDINAEIKNQVLKKIKHA